MGEVRAFGAWNARYSAQASGKVGVLAGVRVPQLLVGRWEVGAAHQEDVDGARRTPSLGDAPNHE